MILDNSVQSPALALWLAQQQLILHNDVDPSQIGVNALTLTGESNTQGPIPATDTFPGGWYVSSLNFGLVFIKGTNTIVQAAAYAQWCGSSRFGDERLREDYFLTMAYYCRDAIRFYRDVAPPRFIVSGYSLGGAIAPYVMGAIRVRGYGREHLCCSFGSPRLVDYADRDVFSGQVIARWMNDDDPVPLLPPPVAVNLAMCVGITPIQFFNWAQKRHVHGGISMDAAGTTTPATDTPRGLLSGSGSLANTIYKYARGFDTAHDLPTYIARLQLVYNRTLPPVNAVVVIGPNERRAEPNRRDANREQQAVVDTIIHAGAAQNQSNLAVPPDKAFRTLKIGPLWWVTFGGVLVAVGPTRKRAGAMALRGNEFLRRLQRMAGVDLQALEFLLPVYLEAASQEGNGFTPPIRDISSL